MTTQCDAWAAEAKTAAAGNSNDIWAGEVELGSVDLKSGPTISGPRTVDTSTLVGVGFHPSQLIIDGDPYRIGGSVNMFGQQIATAGYYDSSTYDFTANFDTTFTHNYSCDISSRAYHPEVVIPHAAEGHYNNCDFGHGQGNDNGGSGVCEDVGQPQASCAAINAIGPTWPHWGFDTEQCKFHITQPAYDEIIPEYWDPAQLRDTKYGSVDKTQTDNLLAHEDAGSGFQVTGQISMGQTVVCISPSNTGAKKPGAWQAKNGYTGDKCNGAWYYGTAPYSPANYAGTTTPNLNTGSHNFVTIPND